MRTSAVAPHMNMSDDAQRIRKNDCEKRYSNYHHDGISSSFGNDSDESETSNCSKRKKNVSFGAVQVRKYNLIVGTNPATMTGPSIEYDWKYKQYKDIPIDKFESVRKDVRRSETHLYIPPHIRKNILRTWGYTDNDFREARSAVNVVRKQRIQTFNQEMRRKQLKSLLGF